MSGTASTVGTAGGLRVDKTITSGTFSLDGGSWQVDNNVWVIGDDTECVVIDAPHTLAPIMDLIGGRSVVAIVCTHAHDDHITVADELSTLTGAPIRLHPADDVLWRTVYPHVEFEPLTNGEIIVVAGIALQVMHTPGHSPGGVCLYSPDLGQVFSGDTLFAGGPGATGRSFSNFDTIIDSISSRLLSLPAKTVVHTGHGPDTTIGAEAPCLPEWIARGH